MKKVIFLTMLLLGIKNREVQIIIFQFRVKSGLA